MVNRPYFDFLFFFLFFISRTEQTKFFSGSPPEVVDRFEHVGAGDKD